MSFTLLDTHINASIHAGLDSAQLLIARHDAIIHHRAYGNANLSTLFDIASLTKIFSITALFQHYVANQTIRLDLTLQEIFPEQFKTAALTNKANITIKMLLAHEAGFEPNPLFYDQNYSSELFCQNREEFLTKLLRAPLIHDPQSQSLYSDVDFMLLTFILEHLLGDRIDQLWSRTFPRLVTERICYQPLQHGYSLKEIAPTELHGNTRDHFIRFDNIRTQTIHGDVQDEKAFHCMNGISGHAGLFANCEALYAALKLMQTPKEFLTSQSDDPSFGLGWRLNKGHDMAYHFGNYASEHAYGHTGWTGCFFVVDPIADITIIYLTNRKHSKVLNPAINHHRFLGDVLWAGQYKNIINEIYQSLGLCQ